MRQVFDDQQGDVDWRNGRVVVTNEKGAMSTSRS